MEFLQHRRATLPTSVADATTASGKTLRWTKAATDQRLSNSLPHSALVLIGNLATLGAQWGVVVILARNAAPEELGRYFSAIAVSSPIFTLMSLRLRHAFINSSTTFSLGLFLLTRLVLISFSCILVAVITNICLPLDQSPIVYLITVLKALDALDDICYGGYQQALQYSRIATHQALKAFGSIVTFYCAVRINANLTTSLGVSATSRVLATLALLIVLHRGRFFSRRGQAPYASPTHTLTAIVMSVLGLIHKHLPLGTVAFLNALTTSISHLALSYWHSYTGLGAFAAASCLTTLPVLMNDAMINTMLPALVRARNELSYKTFWKKAGDTFWRSLVTGGVFFGTAVLFGQVAITYIYSAEYRIALDVLLILICTTIITMISGVFGSVLFTLLPYRKLLPPYIIGAAVSAVTSILFVPLGGLRGTAAALLVTSVAILLTQIWFLYTLRREQDGPLPSLLWPTH